MIIKKNKIVALIPARKGSIGIKNKNIKLFNGHPLVAYSISAAKLIKDVSDIVVSTNCNRISRISKKYGASVPFLRPEHISGSKSTDLQFFLHYINYLKKNNVKLPEYIIHLSPTVPLRDIEKINEAVKLIKSKRKATSLRSVHYTDLIPQKIFTLEKGYLNGLFPHLKGEYYNKPRQLYKRTLIPNGHVDIIRTKYINKNNLHGKNILAFITKKVPDIDTIEDYRNAKETYKEKRFKKVIKNIQ